ncbi:MAG TPA: glycosyltransferase family 2 protein [Flexilinea sp.]|nr:glycosyltransferase family 2 protein [Flexilinea sp.]
MDQIAVLIPCYNEAKTIAKVVNDFKAVLPEAHIYVYDNNSTDGTDILAKEAGADVRYEYQQGKGNVVRRMFQEINAECYILVDGDDTYPADASKEMCDYVLNYKVDMVIGDRLSSTYFSENKRPFHNFGNSLIRDSINRIFHSDVKDVMTGYRAFSFRFVKTFPILSHGFEIETEMTIHSISVNMLLKNVVIKYRDRPEGSKSKLNTFSDGYRVIWTIINLFRNYKPLQFFSLIALILIIIDACVFIPAVWIPFEASHLVERFPTLIVCGFIAMAALLSFFNGIVLDSIMKKERREFEFRLMQMMEKLKELSC